jgi:DNA-binding transcriptional LysR family regulator
MEVAAVMPRARLSLVSIDYLVARDGLSTGKVDVSLSPRSLSGALAFEPIGTTFAVGIVRQGHPQVKGKRLTPALYNGCSHVDVRVTLGASGVGSRLAQTAMKEAGCERRIVLAVPSFTAAALVVSGTDLLGMVPDRSAALLSKLLPVRPVALPFKVPIELGLVWHRSAEDDPAARAFRSIVRASLRSRRPPARL